MLSQSGMNARSRDVFGLRCLPGKIVTRTVNTEEFKICEDVSGKLKYHITSHQQWMQVKLKLIASIAC